MFLTRMPGFMKVVTSESLWQELNDVRNTLRAHHGVAGGTAKSYQKADVTSNAVADCTKARQMYEEALFENGGQGIVEVSSFGEAPQFLSDFGSLRREAEKIGQNSEPLLDTILKV